MQFICQILVLVWLVAGLIADTYSLWKLEDKSDGGKIAVIAITIRILQWFVIIGAGALSLIF